MILICTGCGNTIRVPDHPDGRLTTERHCDTCGGDTVHVPAKEAA